MSNDEQVKKGGAAKVLEKGPLGTPVPAPIVKPSDKRKRPKG